MRIPLTCLALVAVAAAQSGSPFLPIPNAHYPIERPRTRLGDFQAADLRGRVWRTAGLHGKVTLIDIWATSCGPCRADHPELQRFYESIRGNPKLQVLTFSWDADLQRVAAYMAAKHYTFPVILGADPAKLFANDGIPQKWLVDPDGYLDRFRLSPIGQVIAAARRMAAGWPPDGSSARGPR